MYTILDNQNRFYTGFGWSQEYPDARLYPSWEDGIQAFQDLRFEDGLKRRGIESIFLIYHYGEADEEVSDMREGW